MGRDRSVAAIVSVVALAAGVLLAEEPAAPPRCANPSLRAELLQMVNVDQQARLRALRSKSPGEELQKISEQIDRPHTRRLKAIVDAHGWPCRTLVGEDGAHAAWLLVQHAGQGELEFATRALSLMEAKLPAGEVSPADYAYLFDRVAMFQKKPQRYGTQFVDSADGSMVPYEIEAPEEVDELRASMGLPSMAEQLSALQKLYRTSNKPR